MGRRINQVIGHANFRLNEAGDLLKLGTAIAEDVQDGVGITVIPQAGFSKLLNRVIKEVGKWLACQLIWKLKEYIPFTTPAHKPELDLSWVEGAKLPLTVCIDVTIDSHPPVNVPIKFIGGSYDGKEMTLKEGDDEVTLEPDQTYAWNGTAMIFQPDGEE